MTSAAAMTSRVAERGDELRRQIHEHEAGADIVGGTLDMSKAMHGGGIDTGNQAIIKFEEAVRWRSR